MLDYKIIGDDFQYVEIYLDRDETVMAEAGAFMYMTKDIVMETHLGTGGNKGIFGKIMSAGKRLITGESLFVTTFTQKGKGKGIVAFSSPIPGKIIPITLSEIGSIICQKDAYLCSTTDVDISIAFTKKLGAGLLGGEGFILEKLVGDGIVFCNASGTIAEINLGPDDELKIDTGCIVAFTESVDYDIKFVGNIKSAFFGGEGLFFAVLKGPGKVYLQTLPFSRLAKRIIMYAPQTGTKRQGEGSVLGSIFDSISGD